MSQACFARWTLISGLLLTSRSDFLGVRPLFDFGLAELDRQKHGDDGEDDGEDDGGKLQEGLPLSLSASSQFRGGESESLLELLKSPLLSL